MIHEKDIAEAIGLLARLAWLKKTKAPYCDIYAIRVRLSNLGVLLEDAPA